MKHITQLAADLEIPGVLEPSKNGVFLFPITDDLVLEMKEHTPVGFRLFSPVAPLPKLKVEELLILLMKANLYGQGTRGAILGLDEKEEVLTLSLDLLEDTDYRTFKGIVEDFANIVDYWREEVARHVEMAKEGIL